MLKNTVIPVLLATILLVSATLTGCAHNPYGNSPTSEWEPITMTPRPPSPDNPTGNTTPDQDDIVIVIDPEEIQALTLWIESELHRVGLPPDDNVIELMTVCFIEAAMDLGMTSYDEIGNQIRLLEDFSKNHQIIYTWLDKAAERTVMPEKSHIDYVGASYKTMLRILESFGLIIEEQPTEEMITGFAAIYAIAAEDMGLAPNEMQFYWSATLMPLMPAIIGADYNAGRGDASGIAITGGRLYQPLMHWHLDVTTKNTTDRDIIGIRVLVRLYDAFGDPVLRGGMTQPDIIQVINDPIDAGGENTFTLNLMGYDNPYKADIAVTSFVTRDETITDIPESQWVRETIIRD